MPCVPIAALLDAGLAVSVPPASLPTDWPGALEAMPMVDGVFLAFGRRLLAVRADGHCELFLPDPDRPYWATVGPAPGA